VGRRSAFSGASRLRAKTVSDQVELSPSSASSEKLPISVIAGPMSCGGTGPVKYRL
jgi:hypothetical protein